MSLLSRLLGRDRPAPDDVAATVARTVAAVPGVSAQDVSFNWLQYGSGALSGGADVPDLATYDAVLDAAHVALVGMLGDTADRVVVYLGGRGPDGTPYDATMLGLPGQPTGADLARRYSSPA